MEEWSDYRIFLQVAEAGSLSGGARALGISQPTVSRHIARLESHFVEALFTREGQRMELTPLGRIIADHAGRMQAEVDSIARQVMSHDQSLSGPVVISASDGLGGDWLPFALKTFQSEHPDLTFHFDIHNYTANLAGREADIALRWNGPGQQNSLYGRKIAQVKVGLYTHPLYLERAAPLGSIEDITQHWGIGWRSHDFFAWPQSADGHIYKPTHFTVLTDNPASHINAIKVGMGIGVTSHRLARQNGLTRIFKDYEMTHDLWIVAHEDVRKSRRIRAVFDYLIQQAETDAAHFSEGAASVYLTP